MRETSLRITILVFILPLMLIACQPEDQSTDSQKTKAITASPTVQQGITLSDVSCPESFQDGDPLQKELELISSGTLMLKLGYTPSMPCNWGSPTIRDQSLITLDDYYTKWPAGGVTPQPGAPGKAFWRFRAHDLGSTEINLPCYCLDEEGDDTITQGVLNIQVQIKR